MAGVVLLANIALCLLAGHAAAADWRAFKGLKKIRRPGPDYDYIEQPLLVEAADGNLVCVYITNDKRLPREGGWLFATRSADCGRTWSRPVAITPAGKHAGYHSLYKNRGGRIYAVTCRLLVYSDDGGRIWSGVHSLPDMKVRNLDKREPAWSVVNACETGGHVLFPFARFDSFGKRRPAESEVLFYCSKNIATAKDVKALDWTTVPAAPLRHSDWKGKTLRCEEPALVSLGGKRLQVVARTVNGYIPTWTSDDAGMTWSKPGKLRFSDKRVIKHPKAYVGFWRASNGNYLLWHHFNSTPDGGGVTNRRNPVWISGGRLVKGQIRWSQPEILFHHPDPRIGISYAWFTEHKGKYLMAAGNKHEIRIGKIPAGFLDGLWNQHANRKAASRGKVLDLVSPPGSAPLKAIPNLASGGFSVDFRVRFNSLEDNQLVLNYRGNGKPHRGWAVRTGNHGRVRLEMRDDEDEYVEWYCDPGVLKRGKDHHIAFIVDGKADIISVMVDGNLQDGGRAATHGWVQFSHGMDALDGGQTRLKIGSTLKGKLKQVRVYDRALSTSEMIGNYRAGQGPR